MGDSRTAQQKSQDEVDIAARRLRVAELRLMRFTYAEIGEAVGVDKSTVSRDLEAIKGEWLSRSNADYDSWVAEECALLDELQRAVLPEALHGRSRKVKNAEGETVTIAVTNLFAVDRMISIMERRARLLGLDRPVRGTGGGENDWRSETDRKIAELVDQLGDNDETSPAPSE